MNQENRKYDSQFLVYLGAEIKAARKTKGIKQVQLAALCNFEKASMSRIEAGKTNVTALTLHKICNSLQIPVGSIFRGINNLPEPAQGL